MDSQPLDCDSLDVDFNRIDFKSIDNKSDYVVGVIPDEGSVMSADDFKDTMLADAIVSKPSSPVISSVSPVNMSVASPIMPATSPVMPATSPLMSAAISVSKADAMAVMHSGPAAMPADMPVTPTKDANPSISSDAPKSPTKGNSSKGFSSPTRKVPSNSTTATTSSSSSDSSSSSEASIPSAPDGGWGWIVVFASFMAHCIADGCAFSFGILFEALLVDFQDTQFKTAWVGSLFVSMPAMCGPVASVLTNAFGCRRTMIAGGLVAAAGCFLSYFAQSVDALCVTFGVIAGFGLSLVCVPAVIIVAFYFEKKRAFATGLAVSGSGIGTFLFAPLTERLIEVYTWRGTMIIISGLMLNIVVCAALFRPLVAQKLRVKRRKYLRSLERFSRASSRLQSGDALDRTCEHGDAEDETACVFCNAALAAAPTSQSMVQLPTYLTAESTAALVVLDGGRTVLAPPRGYDPSGGEVRQSSMSLNGVVGGGRGWGDERGAGGGAQRAAGGRRGGDRVCGRCSESDRANVVDPLKTSDVVASSPVTSSGLNGQVNGGVSPQINGGVSPKINGGINLHVNGGSNAQSPASDSKPTDDSEPNPPSVTGPHHALHITPADIVKVKKTPSQFPIQFVPQCRSDVFYRGSLLKAGVLLGRAHSASCPDVYVRSPRRRRHRHDVRRWFESFGWRSFVATLRDSCDCAIFRSPVFVSFCVHSMLLYLCYDIPYVYIPVMATTMGIDKKRASWLISIVGISSTIGQVLMGYIGDRSYINCFYFYAAMILLAGLSTLLVPVLTTFGLLAAYCAAFGVFMSANYALTTIIVVELLGMDQLTNAYGFVSLSEGVANLFGPPLAGLIADSHSYDLTFYLAGAGICVSTLLLLVVPLLRRCDVLAAPPRGRTTDYPPARGDDLESMSGGDESDGGEGGHWKGGGEVHVRFTE